MNRTLIASTFLSGALALAAGGAMADDMSKGGMSKGEAPKMEKCYGVAEKGKNDCAGANHSCAGQSTKARDSKEFVDVPTGLCDKIGGKKTSG